MPALSSYDYAILRVVPRVERGEFLNAGVIVFSAETGFLRARIALDAARLRALAPDADVAAIECALGGVSRVCAGEGPIGALPPAKRFDWLTSPRSAAVQTSPVHPGLCADPAAALDRLFETLVRPAPPAGTEGATIQEVRRARRGRERLMSCVRLVFSILIPPLGVFLTVGIGFHFWLSILLTLFGYIPGLVHAVWIIARRS